jgi:2-hydroxychromene-2-carboxylate isomerase
MSGDGATFYYDTNSPYAYLAALRIQDLLPQATWRPVALPLLFRAIGKTPWSLGPGREEGQAGIARRAEERGLPPVRYADGWPGETWSFTPLRAAVFADERGVQIPFALECYRLMFAEGRSLGQLETVLDAARAAGLDPDDVREAVVDGAVKDKLREHTDEAIGLGAVGVPTVAVGGELFWGDDRLEEAAAAASASP